MTAVQPVPNGFHTVTPHLILSDASRAIDFYVKAFGADLLKRHDIGGKLMHATLAIGDSMLMLAEEFPEQGLRSPGSVGETTTTVHLYVDDVDTWYARAVAAGAQAIMPPMDAFWGDRYGMLIDPFGHRWSIATHIEDVADDDIPARAAAAFAAPGEGA